jgi:tetratricopeptide (TPR) repeat protein
MISLTLSRSQKITWAIAVVLFLITSAFGAIAGTNLVHGIAVNFHQRNAEVAIAGGNYDFASKELKALTWLEPENEPALLQLAETQLVLGDWLDARHTIMPVVEAMPSDQFEICRLMTLIESSAGSKNAVKWAARATASSTADPAQSTLLHAHAVRSVGNTQKANRLYNELATNHPNHGEADHHQAVTAEMAMNAEAVAQNRKSIATSSKDYRYTPEFIRMQSRAHRSIKHLTAELKQPEKATGPRLEGLGLALIEVGRWDEGIVRLEEAATAPGGHTWQANYWRGIDAEAKGDVQTALEQFQEGDNKKPPTRLLRRNIQRLKNPITSSN